MMLVAWPQATLNIPVHLPRIKSCYPHDPEYDFNIYTQDQDELADWYLCVRRCAGERHVRADSDCESVTVAFAIAFAGSETTLRPARRANRNARRQSCLSTS